ncbi:MAG: PLP-dependent aminotransferase family protein [Actinomycetaceae bacterium]|nr:PLP-dependent aminotransferase family protein [Actinomycetaceae bacterium]
MRQSEVRSLFAVANRPEVVSLAGGMPNIDGLPLDFLADATSKLIRERGKKALQYGSGQGEEFLRSAICEVMRPDGITANPDNIIVTIGSQQSLDLISQVFLNPGDTVLVEAPSYVGALGVFDAYQADIQHVQMDNDGLIPSVLEETIIRLQKEGKNIKFLYTIPNFHNPGGMCLSAERRPLIVEICKKYNILLVEDNPYGLLGFSGDPVPSLYNLNPEGILYLGTFSKTFAPGFRIGWTLGPQAIIERLVLANESATLCPPAFSQFAITTYLEQYDWYQQVKEYREVYHERGEAMQKALEKYLPDLEWTRPTGGFYTWVKLPDGIDARDMLPRAVDCGVAYVAGNAFYADGETGADHIRLSFCYPSPEEITEGVRRLSIAIKQELENKY